MPRIAYVNGRYLPHAHAMVHIEDRGYQFSDGVYEYIAFYNRRLLDADLHFKRFERSLSELQISPPVTPTALPVLLGELIRRNGRDDGGLYIQATRGVARRDHPFPKIPPRPALVMTVCAAKLPKEHEVKNGVKVITAPDLRWARRDIKSISLLANILAKQQASKAQARESWLIEGDGTVSEGAASNAYIVIGGQVVTHPTGNEILGGITRDVLLKLAKKAGIPVAERAFSAVEMKKAEEAFLTSTSANVLPVVKIDDMTVGSGKPGPVTCKLQEIYNAHVLKQTGKIL